MQTVVRGTANKRLKKLLATATQYYCDKLLSKRIARNIHIEVVLQKDLDEQGYCEIQDYNTTGKARSFLIELDKQANLKTLLTTLAHECVHMKQYATGELNEGLSMWRGRKINSDSVPYWDHPWEIEAYGKERGLFTRFLDDHGGLERVRKETTL
jgi:hypothetical protein